MSNETLPKAGRWGAMPSVPPGFVRGSVNVESEAFKVREAAKELWKKIEGPRAPLDFYEVGIGDNGKPFAIRIEPGFSGDFLTDEQIEKELGPLCDDCSDTGKITCEDCDGFGNHVCDCGDSHDCRKCDGDGTLPCAECDAAFLPKRKRGRQRP